MTFHEGGTSRVRAAFVTLEIGQEVADRVDVAGQLHADLASKGLGVARPLVGARIRVQIKSKVDAEVLTSALLNWAKTARADLSLVIAGTGMPQGEQTKLYQLSGPFAASVIPDAVAEAGGWALI